MGAIRADDVGRVGLLLCEATEQDRKALWPEFARALDGRYTKGSPYGGDLVSTARATGVDCAEREGVLRPPSTRRCPRARADR